MKLHTKILSLVLAAALLGVGLIGEGLLPALPGLDPVGAPVPFMGANLLLLLAAMAVSFNVLRDGLWGLLDEPSLDAMPALATVGALERSSRAMDWVCSGETSSVGITPTVSLVAPSGA